MNWQKLLIVVVIHLLSIPVAGECQKSLTNPPLKGAASLSTSSQREQQLQQAMRHNDIKHARDLINAGTEVGLRIRPDYPYMDLMPSEYIKEVRAAERPTLLMFAVANGQRELVDLLLRKHAPVNSRGDYIFSERVDYDFYILEWLTDATALHIAAYLGDLRIVKRLLKAGALVNLRDGNGRTALFHAAEKGKSSVVSQLIAAHCDVNIADNDGNIALKEAARLGKREIYNQLKRAGAKGDYDIH